MIHELVEEEYQICSNDEKEEKEEKEEKKEKKEKEEKVENDVVKIAQSES